MFQMDWETVYALINNYWHTGSLELATNYISSLMLYYYMNIVIAE